MIKYTDKTGKLIATMSDEDDEPIFVDKVIREIVEEEKEEDEDVK